MKDFIFKKVTSLILPFIGIVGFYVIFHGAVSPGGSFAGGIILALALIVYSTVFGIEEGHKKLPEKHLVWLESFSSLSYLLLGLFGIFKGFPFLSNKLALKNLGSAGSFFSGGLIPFLGLAVGIRVASTMITLFYTMKGDRQ